MRLRKLTAATVAVLAATGLTACKSKAGAAAVVDQQRISESSVSKYALRTGPDPVAAQQAAAQGEVLLPKTIAAAYLVQELVFRAALARTTGGVPDDATLRASHDGAAAMLLRTTLTGQELDDALAAELTKTGLTKEFEAVLLRTLELEKALIDRVKAASPTELAAAVAKLDIPVAVSGRYGKWNPDTLTLDKPSASIPTFINLSGKSAGTQPPKA